MKRLTTLTNTVFRLTVLGSVLVWLWLTSGFIAIGPELTLLRGAILGFGVGLAALILSNHRRGPLIALGACYGLILVPFLAASLAGAGQDDIWMVQIETEGQGLQSYVAFVPQHGLDPEQQLAALMEGDVILDGSHADAYAAQAMAVQTVGRSSFSPMDLGGFQAPELE